VAATSQLNAQAGDAPRCAARWATLAELAARREEWRELVSRSRYPSAFADPAWVLAWFRHYGSEHEAWPLLLSDAHGTMRGLALLALQRSRLTHTLSFAGARENGMEALVCAPEDEALLVHALTEALALRREEWDLWRIERLPCDSELAELLLSPERQPGVTAHDVRLQPYVELSGSRERFEARFSPATRSKFRRGERRLERAGAAARLVSDGAEARAALGTLLELHRRRASQKGERRPYLDERFEGFIGDVLDGLLPHGARLWMLELAGAVVSVRLSFVAGSVEQGFMLGMDHRHATLGPGRELERIGLMHSAAEGRREYDFGPGRDDYKYGWKAVDREMLRALVASPTRRGRLAGKPAGAQLRLRTSAAAGVLRRGMRRAEQHATAAAPRVARLPR
jgi:CelD/BcsL family acetyltransferase involved in cellulose biosynthesis